MQFVMRGCHLLGGGAAEMVPVKQLYLFIQLRHDAGQISAEPPEILDQVLHYNSRLDQSGEQSLRLAFLRQMLFEMSQEMLRGGFVAGVLKVREHDVGNDGVPLQADNSQLGGIRDQEGQSVVFFMVTA